jgi:hypothetical protein
MAMASQQSKCMWEEEITFSDRDPERLGSHNLFWEDIPNIPKHLPLGFTSHHEHTEDKEHDIWDIRE